MIHKLKKNKMGVSLIELIICITLLSIIIIPISRWLLSTINGNNFSSNDLKIIETIQIEKNKLKNEDYFEQNNRIILLNKNNNYYVESFENQEYNIVKEYGKEGQFISGKCDLSKVPTNDTKGCRTIIIKIESKLNSKNKDELSFLKIAPTYAGALPKGSIIPFTGNKADIPEKWHICDGNNNTPNLTDKFIVSTGEDYKLGDIGGQNKVTLKSIQNGNSHTHYLGFIWHNGNSGWFATGNMIPATSVEWPSKLLGLQGWNGSGHGSSIMNEYSNETKETIIPTTDTIPDELKQESPIIETIDCSQSNNGKCYKITTTTKNYLNMDIITSYEIGEDAHEAHENRPPYYATYYIMKIE